MTQHLRFALTAYDPNPTEVTLALSGDTCTIESCAKGGITVEDYKTDADGNPFEIYLKVSPEPIAFIMRFINGQMTIEFKGNWTAFKTECLAAAQQQVIEIPVAVEPQVIEIPAPVPEPVPEPVVCPVPPQTITIQIASSIISFKVHFKETDVDAMLIQLTWDGQLVAAHEGAGKYQVVFQKDTPEGREFVVVVTHPDGERYVLRCRIKDDLLTILNTDLWEESNLEFYLTFFIGDADKIAAIKKEIDDNPDKSNIGILYSHGCFGEGIDLGSIVIYILHLDADGNQVPKKQDDDDAAARRAREAREKAEAAGKKGTEPPEDGKDWSCGRVKWELPEPERTYRDVGKLKIPDFGSEEEGSHLRDVGKLKWGGFENDEEEEKPKEKPKVGKLNVGMFGQQAEEPKGPPPKKSWKKK